MENLHVMELVICKEKHFNNETLLEPANPLDKPLFMHCTCGLINVTMPYFYESIDSVLKLHGIKAVIKLEE